MNSCTCSGGSCNGGYCLTESTCYFSVTCEGTGWTGLDCSIADTCDSSTLTTGKTCLGTGCSSGVALQCSASTGTQCTNEPCGGVNFNCTYNGTWAWRSTPIAEICGDGEDGDCDGLDDATDPDCSTPCKEDGEVCEIDSNCCSYPQGGGCDSDDGKCYSCNGPLDHEGICEEGCGGNTLCDEVLPGTIAFSASSCCDSSCFSDRYIGASDECICRTDNCQAGWCLDSPNCFYDITCGDTGWAGTHCINSICTPDVITLANCYSPPMGCSHPDEFWCSDTNHASWECQSRLCLGYSTTYYCSYNGSGWAWRDTGYSAETGNCDDGEDNDCDEYFDCDDSDCTGDPVCPVTKCFFADTNYHTEIESGAEYASNFGSGIANIGYRLCFSTDTCTYRASVRWDTSNVPDTATVTDVNLEYDCSYNGGGAYWGYIRPMQLDPSDYPGTYGSEPELLYNDCGNGTEYAGGTSIFPIVGTNQEINLGSQAVTDVQSQLSDDWFAVGLQRTNEGYTSYYTIQGTSGGNPIPTVCITYTP